MITLKTKREIEKRIDDIVERAQKLIGDTKVYKEMKPTQLSNLLNFACATDSIKAIEVFVLYQMGRRDTQKQWQYNEFGDKFLSEISELKKVAQEIAHTTRENEKSILLELVRIYIGYANRYFVYCAAVKKSQKEEEEEL